MFSVIQGTDSLQLVEPVTTITDYLLAAQAAGYSFSLWQRFGSAGHRSHFFWSMAFAMLAVGAFVGGTSHGFHPYLSVTTTKVIWKSTVYSIGFVSFFISVGTAYASLSGFVLRAVLVVASLQLAAYGFWMIRQNDFLFVVLDYVPSLVAVIVLQVLAYRKFRAASAKWLISGVLVSFAAAGIQVSGFDLHVHFNHNDLYHVVQMLGIYLFYRGTLLMSDTEEKV